MDDYFNLGSYSRDVTTTSVDAQRWFDRGLVWCYGFNHEEAITCFEKALEHDPDCAMAHWGIAYAAGPNYNKQWADFDDEEKRTALAQAQAANGAALKLAAGATPIERALIEALARRHPDNPAIEDCGPWIDAYAEAMRAVYKAHPGDLDVCTLFAEALMNRTPWQLWDLPTGAPADGADTLEAMAAMESTLRDQDAAYQHPGLLHMYVHLMEMSPHPENALKAGDVLKDLVPDAGHLVHMATHIDVLCGHYENVVARNHAAVLVDRKYLDHAGAMNFYTLYRSHNLHFKIYGAMFLGQPKPALDAAEELMATTSREVLEAGMADWLEAFVPMKQHVLIRFGMWDDILAQDLPDDPVLYSFTTAMTHYARAVALAATGKVAEAEAEREAFATARAAVPETRMLFNNTATDILKIAQEMVDGELEYRRGNLDAAFAHLRHSVELDDTMPYDEPWGWMQPTRHALGALLLEQGRSEEAETVYRADLGLDGVLSRACQHPDNVWSLHGLHECLKRRGETIESVMIKQRLDLAMARADVPIKASCYCRMTEAA